MDRNDNQRTLLTIKIKNKMENQQSTTELLSIQTLRVENLKSTISILEDTIKLKDDRIKMLEQQIELIKCK